MSQGLSDEEKEILDLIKEFTKKKAIVELLELITYLTNKLRLNQRFTRIKIEKIVKNLVTKQQIVLGTKLTKDDILNIDLRKKICQFIFKNPGININNIMQEFNIGSNQSLWHLNMLKDFGFIKMVEIKNQKALFHISVDSDQEKILFYFRKDNIKKIIDLLKQSSEPLKPSEMAVTLNIHYNTIKKYVDLLCKLNLIKNINGDRKKRYILNQETFNRVKNAI